MTAERRRRAHPAALARLATTGLSTALTLGLVAAMGWPTTADAPVVLAVEEAPRTSPTPTTDPAPAPVRVVVRRHHPAPVRRTVVVEETVPGPTAVPM